MRLFSCLLLALGCLCVAIHTHDVELDHYEDINLQEELSENAPEADSWLVDRIERRERLRERELREAPWMRDRNGPWRLPSNLKPDACWLTVRPYFPSMATQPVGRNFTFDGSVSIRMRSTVPTDTIVLHARNLSISQGDISLTDPLGGVVALANEAPLTNSTYDFLFIKLATGTMLQANVDYTLSINYTGLIFNVNDGGMLKATVQYNGMTKWIISTQFESRAARRMLPCFDEPAMKAAFHVKIEHPSEMRALSNGMERGTEDIGMGWSRTTFAPTKRMSNYLLALAIGELVSKTQVTEHGTLVRVWSWPGTEPYMDLALYTAVKVLEAGGNELLSPFPLEKEDLLAIPFWSGAMENWGLVIFTYRSILFDHHNQHPSQSSVMGIISHELAHQWFGDLVTTEWWDDLFLNEAMATFWSLRFIRKVFPEQEYLAMGAWVFYINYALGKDAIRGIADTVHHPNAGDPSSHRTFFGYATYQKGGALFRMLQHVLGDEVFINGLRRYIAKYGYGSARHNDLWAEFTAAAAYYGVLDWNHQPLNVAQLMNPWIDQLHFPIVNVNLQNGNLQFSQTPVVNVTGLPPSPYNYQWHIPLWYRNSRNPDVTQMRWILPKCSESSVSLNCSMNDTTVPMTRWEVENVDWRSFIRVNYDANLFKMLIDQLVKHPETSVSFTTSQMLLAASSEKKVTRERLDVSLLFRDQRLRRVWMQGFAEFEKLELMFRNHPSRVLVARYFEYLFAKMYNETDCQAGDINDCAVHQLIETEVCRYNFSTCPTERHLRLFHRMADVCGNTTVGSLSCNIIEPLDRSVVYCSAAANSEANWEQLWTFYQREKNQMNDSSFEVYLRNTAITQMLYGLTCTKNRDKAFKLLDASIQEGLQTAMRTTGYFVKNTASMPFMWEYLESRVNITTSRRIAHNYMTQLVRTMNMDVYKAKLEIFRDTHQLSETMMSAVSRAIFLVQRNIAQFNHDGPITDRWLWDKFATQCMHTA